MTGFNSAGAGDGGQFTGGPTGNGSFERGASARAPTGEIPRGIDPTGGNDLAELHAAFPLSRWSVCGGPKFGLPFALGRGSSGGNAQSRSGPDNRHEPSDLRPVPGSFAPTQIALNSLAVCGGVAIVVPSYLIEQTGEDAFVLPLGRDHMPGKFQRQPSIPTRPASAFLVGPQHMVTAVHALSHLEFDEIRFVFGFTAIADRAEYVVLTRSQIVRPARELGRVYCERDGDALLLELESEVDAAIARPLPLAPKNAASARQEVALIGYPRGQPLKITVWRPGDDGTRPRIESVGPTYIHSNVDAFQGNSGCALVDVDGRVIGVHKGGGRDIDALGNEVVTADTDAQSRSTRIEVLAAALKRAGIEFPVA